jgi:hypothetical protein
VRGRIGEDARLVLCGKPTGLGPILPVPIPASSQGCFKRAKEARIAFMPARQMFLDRVGVENQPSDAISDVFDISALWPGC